MEMVPPGSYRPAYSSNNNDGDDNITSLVCNTFRTNEVLGGKCAQLHIRSAWQISYERNEEMYYHVKRDLLRVIIGDFSFLRDFNIK